VNREPGDSTILRVEGLKKAFPLKQPVLDVLLRKPALAVKAVDGVSLSVRRGETLGLVGESGCGKSTLARCILRLEEPDAGRVTFEGQDITAMSKRELRQQRKKMQIIFQDPYSSLNPRMSIREMLEEVLIVHRICPPAQITSRLAELLEMVGMSPSTMDRFPGEFSGGQRQRLGIARALAVDPVFVIADEPVSSLDVSIQAQIINLIEDLQRLLSLTVLFISHDLRVIRHVTDRVAVMYLGSVVEMAPTGVLFDRPYHPYTKVLLAAAPALDPRTRRKEFAIEGEPPSPINLPRGCRFHPRCVMATAICQEEEPSADEVEQGRIVSCHFWNRVS